MTAVPGVRSLADLDALLPFLQTTPKENDYAVIGSFTPQNAVGNCVYCNHCQPCPAGIDVGLVNKYYDLALAGDAMAANHYGKLTVNADDCRFCGYCNSRCPFHVDQMRRMSEMAQYFG